MSDSGVRLARRLGTGDAVVVGLTAMLGAGVFAAFTPAYAAAGAGLLIGLAIAAVVAFCNATSSAQLAMHHPSSGGTYLFGRVVLGPWWGFVAGWGFVIGKTASCAAMAMTFAHYALPGGGDWQRLLAAGAVLVLTGANLVGVTRTARVGALLLTLTLAALLIALVVLATGDARATDPWVFSGGPLGVLQSAGLLFFAFAGYARIATLAEEVRRPEMLGRAILIALGVAVVVYTAVALMLLLTLGTALGSTPVPLATAVDVAGADWAAPVVRLGAAAASLGALLALLAGVGRTSLAMARERDLPAGLAVLHARGPAPLDGQPRTGPPVRAQMAVGLIAALLAASIDLRGAIGFSSFGVLVYYAVANLAALRQPAEQRRWPRALQVLGLTGCLVLALTVPPAALLTGLGVLALGVAGRALVLRRRS